MQLPPLKVILFPSDMLVRNGRLEKESGFLLPKCSQLTMGLLASPPHSLELPFHTSMGIKVDSHFWDFRLGGDWKKSPQGFPPISTACKGAQNFHSNSPHMILYGTVFRLGINKYSLRL